MVKRGPNKRSTAGERLNVGKQLMTPPPAMAKQPPATRMWKVKLADGTAYAVGEFCDKRKIVAIVACQVAVPGIGPEIALVDAGRAPIVLFPYHALVAISTKRVEPEEPGESKILRP